jgi:hypothetical protein
MHDMRKFIVAITAVAALAAPAAALANASNIPGNVTGTVPGSTQGAKNNQVTQYKAAYSDYFFGGVSCSGTHHATATGSFDSFTCTSTTGKPLTNVAPNQSLSLATFGGWNSDYDAQPATIFTGTVSPNGMSYTAVANY